MNSLRMLALALALATAGAPAGFAQTPPAPGQSDEDRDAHHPASAETPSVSAPAAARAVGMPMGMMSGDMNQMMTMMRNMMTMMGAQSGMMSSNVEGRIASFWTELKITNAQTPQWDRFADALRATSKSMNGMFEQMMQTVAAATLPARLDRQETMLTAHLNSLKTLKEALGPLYASLSGEQKIGERRDAILGAQSHQIRRLALELTCILNQHNAVRGAGNLDKQRVDERRLAGRRATGDEDIAALHDGKAKDFRLLAGHDPGRGIVAQREDRDGGLADRECGRSHDRRDQPLEALARSRQLG